MLIMLSVCVCDWQQSKDENELNMSSRILCRIESFSSMNEVFRMLTDWSLVSFDFVLFLDSLKKKLHCDNSVGCSAIQFVFVYKNSSIYSL